MVKQMLASSTWMVTETVEGLVCPACGTGLMERQETICCESCGESWPVRNGVPHFLQSFPYWGEIPQAAMQGVNHAASSGPWRSALLESPDPEVRRASAMMLNLERANWHYLTDVPRNARVLDLGAGTGTNSHALSLHYREVVAVEPVSERVEFMRHRFAQEGLSNIQVVRSSLWKLPFGPESFDLLVMNGILEWVAEGQTGDPEEIQSTALRKAASLLKPGGCLYLGIENRYCPGYFIGYPDPHSGIPFVTVLPRPLAHWYARRKGFFGGYRNYLYSSRGYRKLLERNGFSRVEIYLALPSYNQPRFLIPLKSDLYSCYARNFVSGRSSRLRNIVRELLLKVNLLKYMDYSFAILAYK